MNANRSNFLASLRSTLGSPDGRVAGAEELEFVSSKEAEARSDSAEAESSVRADELMDALESSASRGGWKVHKAEDIEDALGRILDIARGLGARSVVRSGHAVLDRMGVDRSLADEGIELTVMEKERPEGGPKDTPGRDGEWMREKALGANLGLTGADFAVAETGSVVLRAGAGVSRIVSLAPPVHIAVVERGTVLAGLDELFAMLRREAGSDDWASYVNIITGPSRSADIEYTLVTGVHGPGEVHMVLVG